jgi:hypothetical protein
VRIVPAIPDIGRPVITNSTTGQQDVKAGQTAVLSLGLSGEALSRPEQFRLAAVYANADPAGTEGAWTSATTLDGVDTNNQITIEPWARPVVNAKVLVPNGATAVDFSLRAQSLHNSPASDGQSLPLRLVVGKPLPVNEAGVRMHIGELGANAKEGMIDGVAGLLVRFRTNPVIRMQAEFTKAGRYTFSASVENAGADWTVTQPTDVVTAAVGDFSTVEFELALNAAGPATTKRLLTFTATTQDQGGASRTSSVSFPVMGFA